jgi:hypothetical protein
MCRGALVVCLGRACAFKDALSLLERRVRARERCDASPSSIRRGSSHAHPSRGALNLAVRLPLRPHHRITSSIARRRRRRAHPRDVHNGLALHRPSRPSLATVADSVGALPGSHGRPSAKAGAAMVALAAPTCLPSTSTFSTSTSARRSRPPPSLPRPSATLERGWRWIRAAAATVSRDLDERARGERPQPRRHFADHDAIARASLTASRVADPRGGGHPPGGLMLW